MKAKDIGLLDFLFGDRQLIVPVYQRTYDWRVENCFQLWSDVVRAGRDDHRSSHFLGSVVHVNEDDGEPGAGAQRVVIDGQQRLTTITLMLVALRDLVAETGEAVRGLAPEALSAGELQARFLTVVPETDAGPLKLILSQGDRHTLTHLITGGPKPAEVSNAIDRNFAAIREWMRDSGVSLDVVAHGLAKLTIVEVTLDRSCDHPQQIFESLNNTGRDLEQADLVRNYLLMGLSHRRQARLHQDYWFPMEQSLKTASLLRPRRESILDAFLRDLLTMKTGTTPNVARIYEEFKAYYGAQVPSAVQPVLEELVLAAKHYQRIVADADPNANLARRFRDLTTLEVNVAYPLVLALYGHYSNGALTLGDFMRVLDAIESYVLRRAACQLPTNSLNKMFASLTQRIDPLAVADSVIAGLMVQGDRLRFPADSEVVQAFDSWNLYASGRCEYVLLKLENHDQKELVLPKQYTIEHVMPQGANLPEKWQEMLGPDWERVQEKRRHTLGNLTLTGYNSELSNRPFAEKCTMAKGFRESRLRLNKRIGDSERWTEVEIAARGEQLAALAVTEVWPRPALDTALLEKYVDRRDAEKEEDESGNENRVEDRGEDVREHHHGHLQGPVRDVYDQLVQHVRGFGTDVHEPRFLNNYVAFDTAGGTFFDAKAQAKRLVLRLRLDYADVDDPSGICEDNTGKGRPGYGVRINLGDLDDIAEALEFVRQAYWNNRLPSA